MQAANPLARYTAIDQLEIYGLTAK